MTEPNFALPAGFELEHYRIEQVLGTGAFSITYKAWDSILEQWVAIKEFLPREFAQRSSDRHTVRPCSDRPEQYHYGLNRFLDEARALARFQHPNIVRVQRFIEANATAYLIMEWQQGHTLAELLRQQPRLPERQIVEIIGPLLQGLIEVHGAGFLHRDIKPDNIYLREPGGPMLIDFGASREAIGNRDQDLTRILSPGYAPPEQYTTDASKQSTWTDLYALGGVMYRCVSGVKPDDSPTRREALHDGETDPMIPAVVVGRGQYSEALLSLIDQLLEPRYQGRPASAQAVLNALQNGLPFAAAVESDDETEFLRHDDETELLAPSSDRPQMPGTGGQNPPVEHGIKSLLRQRPAITLITLLLIVAVALGWRFMPGQEIDTQVAVANEEHPLAEAVISGSDTGEINEVELPVLEQGLPESTLPSTNTSLPAIEPLEQPVSKRVVASTRITAAAPSDPETLLPGPLFRDVMKDGGEGPELLSLPVGSFRMGDLNGVGAKDEKPVHTVRIKSPIAIMVREVSFDEYDRFAQAAGKLLPNDKGWGRGARPVIEVSWNDARDYAQWISDQTGERYRLPSEAEWEFAARAGTITQYPWGNRASHEHANYGTDKCCDGRTSGADQWLHTAPVGSFPANPWGLHDMQGNVYEWVEDCYVDSYRGAPTDGGARTTEGCTYRVLRGGSWDIYPLLVRPADRFWLYATERNDYVGFRLVREMGERQNP